jgi:TldD protein
MYAMKRRDFVKHSSLTLAAAAASSAWLEGVFEGRAFAKAPSIFDTYFGVGSAEMEKLLGVALSKGGDFADLFFEHRVNSSLFFEEDIVKNASRGIIQGVGVRVVKGDQVGFAFTEDLTMDSMAEAARTAAAIANDTTAKARVQPVAAMNLKNLYPVKELASEAALTRKLGFIKEANAAARGYSPKITKVQCFFSDQVKYLAYVNSDGVSWTDAQPTFNFGTVCIAEEGSNRQDGYDGSSARMGLEYFSARRSAADIAKEAARLAVLNLEAKEIEAGPMTVVLGNAHAGILLHEAVGHGLEADFNYKKLANYSDRVGQKVASELCTVVDEGTFENMAGTLNVDDEGNLTGSAVLIENGILRGYLHDRISAKQMRVKATGNGRRQAYNYSPMPRMTNTYMRAGKSDPAEIIASTKRGVYAKKFGNGQVDITKGDFVFTVTESYLIEDGKVTSPLKGLTLIGNGPDVMTKVEMVGNDLAFSDSGWMCGKRGQSVPVSMGMPTTKVSEITVGGTKVKA